MTNALTHKFTESGLGEAPFSFMGVQENLFRMPDGFSKPGGCCDHCYTGLRWEYVIRSADGIISKVGSSCIRKVGDKGLISRVKAEEATRRREANRSKREAEYQAKLAAQRERNGGKTDQEIRQEKSLAQERKYEAARENAISILTPVAADLADGKGRFRDNVSSDLRLAVIPSPRAVEIIGEILGSAATDKIEQAQQILAEARA